MPKRSRAQKSFDLLSSHRAKANIPRNFEMQSTPQRSYAFKITSVSEFVLKSDSPISFFNSSKL